MKIAFGKEGCFVKVRGYRTKHIVVSDDHVGNHLPNCITIKEIKTGDERHTTWRELSEWRSA